MSENVSRKLVLDGSEFEDRIGYARAVVVGPWVFVSGTTGFDYQTKQISGDVVEQAAQTLRNIDRALERAEASRADIVQVRYIFPNRDDFPPCWPVLQEYFGPVRPTATMWVADLADPRCRVEIEVVAYKDSKAAE